MGKAQEAPPTPEYTAPANNQDSEMAMMQMMMQMMQNQQMMSQQAQYRMPDIPDAPKVGEYDNVDWNERMSSIATKARGEQAVKAANRRGRASTNVTGPLVWGEDTTTTNKSVLTGK